MKVILLTGRIGKDALKIEKDHSFWNTLLFQMDHSLWNGWSSMWCIKIILKREHVKWPILHRITEFQFYNT